MQELAQNLPSVAPSQRRPFRETSVGIEIEPSTPMRLSSEERQEGFNDLCLGKKLDGLDEDNQSKARPHHRNLQEVDGAAPRAALNSSADSNSTQEVRGQETLRDLRSQRQDQLPPQPSGIQTLHDLTKQRENESTIMTPIRNLCGGLRDTRPIATVTKEAPKSNAPTLDQLQDQMEQLEAQLKTYMRSARGARPPSFLEEARMSEE
jgi:hypothetical protein